MLDGVELQTNSADTPHGINCSLNIFPDASHTDIAIPSDSAVITDKDRDPIDVPSVAENANPARMSSQLKHIQELSSTGVELEEEHYSDSTSSR